MMSTDPDLIRDPKALAEIRRSWNGVEALRSQLQRSAFASATMGLGGVFPHKLADAAHNLPFIHAYAVLNQTLLQAAQEGRITCKSIFLGKLMEAAKNLAWQNLELVSAGIQERNGVAHRGKLVSRDQCWKYIDAVGGELKAWGVLI